MPMTKIHVLGLLLALCSLLVPSAMAGKGRAGGILYVKPDAGGDCGDWATACSLQAALVQAVPGDEVWVAAGTYVPSDGPARDVTFQLQIGVALYGGFAGAETSREERDWEAHPTILSGDIGVVGDGSDNSYHVVTGSGTDGTAVLDGFVVSDGNAIGSEGLEGGGGMYNESGSPTVRNVIFCDNEAGLGGGMGNLLSSPMLQNVTFEGNSATSGGGMSIFDGSPRLDSVVFDDNTATQAGGGLEQYGGSPTLKRVIFVGNQAAQGGGLSSAYGSITLANVEFLGNSAGIGGGMYSFEGSPALANVLFSGNTATDAGGGMHNDRFVLSCRGAVGAMAFAVPPGESGGPSLASVTFGGNSAGNAGGALFNRRGGATLDNCILWGNSAPAGAQIWNEGGVPVIHASLVQDSGGSGTDWDAGLGTDGGGNLDDDPMFVNDVGEDGIPGTGDDDLRLPPDSPAVDAGDNGALPPDVLDLDDNGDTAEPLPLDLDGNPRLANEVVDMGAYETDPAPTHIYLPAVFRTY